MTGGRGGPPGRLEGLPLPQTAQSVSSVNSSDNQILAKNQFEFGSEKFGNLYAREPSI